MRILDSKKLGFTLIELMVVISILAILVAIGVTSYSIIRKNSRDSIRKADLHTIQNALEQYYGKNETYPSDIATLATQSYLSKGEPLDPKKGCSYKVVTLTATSYEIRADLESSSDYCNMCDELLCDTLPITYEEYVKNLQ